MYAAICHARIRSSLLDWQTRGTTRVAVRSFSVKGTITSTGTLISRLKSCLFAQAGRGKGERQGLCGGIVLILLKVLDQAKRRETETKQRRLGRDSVPKGPSMASRFDIYTSLHSGTGMLGKFLIVVRYRTPNAFTANVTQL